MTATHWVPIIVATIAALAGIVTHRMARRATRAASYDALAGRLDKAEARMDASLRRERLRDDYIHELRDHISQGNPPPPPPWPAGLTT